MPFQFDVFVSHSSHDGEFAQRLARRLRADGLRVWLAEWEIRPGDPISIRIERGLEASRSLLLLISSNAIASEWVTLERHTLLYRDPTNTDRRLVPVRIANCSVPGALAQFAYIDYVAEREESYKSILLACRPETFASEGGTIASGSDPQQLRDILLKLLDFSPDKDLEGYTLELRAHLAHQLGTYASWPAQVRSTLESSMVPSVMLFLGSNFSMEGEHLRAAECFRRAADLAGTTATRALATIRLGASLERLGQYEDALTLLASASVELAQAEQSVDEYWWAVYQEALCHKGARRFHEARRILGRVRDEAEPRDRHKVLALYQAGQIDLMLGQVADAEAKFRQCKTEMTESLSGHRRAYALRGLGVALTQRGQLEEAKAELIEARRVCDKYFDTRYRLKVLTSLVDVAAAAIGRSRNRTVVLDKIRHEFGLDDEFLRLVFTRLRSSGLRYVDLIDAESGTETGEAVTHESAHERGEWHSTVHIVVFEHRDRAGYVLLRRRPSEPSQGRWDLSASGHRDVGENDTDAAVRKAFDELGLRIDKTRLRRFGSQAEFRKVGSPVTKDDRHEDVRTFAYRCDAFNKERTTLFLYGVDAGEREKVTGNGRAVCQWLTLSDALAEAQKESGRFSSAFRQLMHPRLTAWIGDELRRAAGGS